MAPDGIGPEKTSASGGPETVTPTRLPGAKDGHTGSEVGWTEKHKNY